MNIVDIRQSDAWSTYIKMYGWQSHKLPNGGVMRVAKFPLFSLAKIQRAACLTRNDLEEVKSVCKKNRVIYLKTSPAVEQDLRVLEDSGYKRRGEIDLPPRTIIVKLQDDESVLWRNLTKDCRYSINKSEKAHDTIELVQKPTVEQIENYYKVIKARAKLANFYTPSLADHVEKIKCFGKESFICTAYSESGDILGSKMFLGFNGCIWYMYSGLTDLGSKSCGNYKLMWESIKFFKGLGYKAVDMEGLFDNRLKRLTKRWRNYSDFKLQFGGTVLEYPLPRSKFCFFYS
jgi:hypothetical protein